MRKLIRSAKAFRFAEPKNSFYGNLFIFPFLCWFRWKNFHNFMYNARLLYGECFLYETSCLLIKMNKYLFCKLILQNVFQFLQLQELTHKRRSAGSDSTILQQISWYYLFLATMSQSSSNFCLVILFASDCIKRNQYIECVWNVMHRCRCHVLNAFFFYRK